jgi:hypothetical protein
MNSGIKSRLLKFADNLSVIALCTREQATTICNSVPKIRLHFIFMRNAISFGIRGILPPETGFEGKKPPTASVFLTG